MPAEMPQKVLPGDMTALPRPHQAIFEAREDTAPEEATTEGAMTEATTGATTEVAMIAVAMVGEDTVGGVEAMTGDTIDGAMTFTLVEDPGGHMGEITVAEDAWLLPMKPAFMVIPSPTPGWKTSCLDKCNPLESILIG